MQNQELKNFLNRSTIDQRVIDSLTGLGFSVRSAGSNVQYVSVAKDYPAAATTLPNMANFCRCFTALPPVKKLPSCQESS